ncbi:LacI family DNA-binding transcriptional regulator [Shewanella woodyi]|uniref:LacI family DNA-binding transcriptional regulator n=1 Tax=Shewanella woodyi TaxID=60961 RepID=UPI0007F8DFD2|nr:LacI family DNA-binding transcriptional regulator [Shewanella woodyi]
MATIYDVSVLAGVSLATVSRVMNKNTNVSEKTKKKVQDAMDQLGYRPSSIAQSLASNRSNSIGVLVSQLDGPFYGPMMTEIETALRDANKHVIIAAGHSNETQEKEAVEFLLDRGCDALILDVEALSDEYIINLCQQSTPIVLINRFISEIEERCIYLNNALGGYLATKHVLSQGHTQLAYIAGPQFKSDARERLEGHKQALAEFEVTFDETLFFEGNFREPSGVSAMEFLLKQDKQFTCVISANDQMASGAIAVSLERDISVPKQLSFIGYDNSPFPKYISPKLSTVSNPIQEMGKMAALWVLKNVYNKPDLSIVNTFTPQLILRDSVKSLK